MKQALGLVEIEGLSTAVLAADAMAKAANVRILGIENAKGMGYMAIKVVGDVGAVNASVSAGKQVGVMYGKLVSSKVIARPADYVEQCFCNPHEQSDEKIKTKPEPETISETVTELEPKKTELKKLEPKKTEPKKLEPKKTEPKELEPKKTEPKELEPKESESKELEPKKTERKESERKESEPKKTEPPKMDLKELDAAEPVLDLQLEIPQLEQLEQNQPSVQKKPSKTKKVFPPKTEREPES